MKAIMYHYVRKSDKNLPFFRYLDFDNFKKQLDFFEQNYSFLSYQQFLNLCKNPPQNEKEFSTYKDKILLTFDDGLKDHFDFVFKELLKRELFGLFFIPTGVYERKKALDVHRIHFILGKLGGKEAFKLANQIIEEFTKNTKQNIVKDEEKDFFKNKIYLNQNNDFYTSEFKKLFNYYIKYEFRQILLDILVEKISSNEEIFINLYANLDELRIMQENQMIIGSHSVNHFVFSKLDKEKQYLELKNSFDFLDKNLAYGGGGLNIKTFCYPYGGAHTYTAYTKKLLNKMGVRFSFDVNYKDIEFKDFIDNPQALPRYDCNLFKYGQANLG